MTPHRRLPSGMLRRLILSAVLGIALGAVAWYFGMDAPHAIGLGAVVFAFSSCLSALGEAVDLSWPMPPPPPRPGARRDVVQLGWSLSSRGGRASPEGIRALRLVAERALQLRGLDLEDRSADAHLAALLGSDLLALLRRGSAVQPPRTAQVAAALDRLEALVRDDAPAGATVPTRPRASTRHTAPTRPTAPTPEETPRAR
ncbi:hypothetical protein AB4Z18_07735 [Leifsonia sp. 2TAF2]|uniref:hypothetical protein n=1 Tax=Leifsonia sp. 2TAF2 TaxID=3233009 RepID=UPI003F95F877